MSRGREKEKEKTPLNIEYARKTGRERQKAIAPFVSSNSLAERVEVFIRCAVNGHYRLLDYVYDAHKGARSE